MINCNWEVKAKFEKDFEVTDYKYSNDSRNICCSNIKNSGTINIKLVFKKNDSFNLLLFNSNFEMVESEKRSVLFGLTIDFNYNKTDYFFIL